MTTLWDHFKVGKDREQHEGELLFNDRLLGPVPYRGRKLSPALTQDDVDLLETRPVGKVLKFDLSDPAQLDAYELVVHRACMGWYKVLFCERRFDPEKKDWLVYCEWCQLYQEAPPHLREVLEGGHG